MAEKFKVHDLVEVPMLKGLIGRDWIIVGIASNGGEAIIRRIDQLSHGEQTIIELSKLKHQKKEGG